MKRDTYYLLIGTTILVVLLSSCVKDSIDNSFYNNTKGLKAVIVDNDVKTRTVLMDNPGVRIDVMWQPGDEVGVFGTESGNNVKFSISSADISSNGKEASFTSSESTPQGDTYAYYPYQSGAQRNSSGVLELSFPSTQLHTLINFTPQPYAPANMMVGKGNVAGIGFKNIFSILKIGLTIPRGETIKQVVFKDLSGKPVSGPFKVSWDGDNPTTIFPADGDAESLTLKLDCGTGVEFDSAQVRFFYMIVPAREYPNGFEVKFETLSGNDIVKTVGANGGKRLIRSVVYPIGETAYVYDGAEYEVGDDVVLLNADSAQKYIDNVIANGYTSGGEDYLFLNVNMKKEVAPQVGGVLVLNYSTDEFPGGYAGRVTARSNSGSDVVTIETEPITDITEVFENLTLGDPMWTDDGSFDSIKGVGLDLAPYLTKIVMADGADLEFTRSGSQIMVDVPLTRAGIKKTSISTPKVIFSTDKDKAAKVSLGLQIDLDLAASMSIHKRSLEYFHLSVEADVNMDASFKVSRGINANKEMNLFTAYFTPIPVGPVMIRPAVVFKGVLGVGGEFEVSATLEYKRTVRFGFSYAGGGIVTRSSIEPPTPDQGISASPGIDGYVYADAGVKIEAGFSVWGLLNVFASADTRLAVKTQSFGDDEGDWLHARRGFVAILSSEIGASIFSLGGALNKRAQIATIEFPPMKKWYITPIVSPSNKVFNSDSTELTVFFRVHGTGLFPIQMGVVLFEGDPGVFPTNWDWMWGTSFINPETKLLEAPLGTFVPGGDEVMSTTIPLSLTRGKRYVVSPCMIFNGEYRLLRYGLEPTIYFAGPPIIEEEEDF